MLMVISAVGGSSAGAQKARSPNLQGTWTLDATKSDPLFRGGKPVANGTLTLIIEHREPTVNIRRVVGSPSGEQVRLLSYSTDGKENKNPSIRGAEVISTSSWQQDKLVTKGRQLIDSPLGRVYTELAEVWTLSPDGKTLTIESKTTVPVVGARTHKEVFVKKG